MSELYELLTHLVALNGGTVVGKTRLQKTVYLLDQCGLSTGCAYDYHYYGPFSAEIAEAADDACELGHLKYGEKLGFHAVPYGFYEISGGGDVPDRIGGLSRSVVKKKLEIMTKYSAIELELAATILYLRSHGSENPIEEARQLKAAKATLWRVERAEKLLQELEL